MAFVQWQPEFTTGWTAYDTQHQALFEHVNAVHELIEGFNPEDEPRLSAEFLDFLNLVRVHARTEDGLMAELGHPPASDHVSAHGNFLGKLEGVQSLHAFGPESHPAILECLAKFKTHFLADDEQSFLALLRTQPPT